ncbi:hypothetical protein [uncultured Sulfurimonas sp.]|jgi:hypothetical protein|nr:hypothetical protein [Sulfurimonas sp.]
MYYKKPTSLELSINLIKFPMIVSIFGVIALLISFFTNPIGLDNMEAINSYEKRYSLIFILSLKSIFFYVLSKELKKKKSWARIVTVIAGVLLLIAIPIGTIVGLILIYNMTKGWSKEVIDTTNKYEETNNLP